MGKIDATENGHGIIRNARLAEENVDDDESPTLGDMGMGDSIAFRNQYIGCSTCGFSTAAVDRRVIGDRRSLDDPGSMTCDSCSGARERDFIDLSETKPCCTAQRLESGVLVDDWKPSASLPPARPVNPRSGSRSIETLYTKPIEFPC